eukprot:3223144-Pyramimonas_sp.AAC.1
MGFTWGYTLVTSSRIISWAAPSETLRSRCHHMRSLSWGLVRNIAAYNLIGHTVLSHLQQFFPPVPAAYKAVREGVQGLTAAPRFAITNQMLESSQIIGLPSLS